MKPGRFAGRAAVLAVVMTAVLLGTCLLCLALPRLVEWR